MLYILLAAIEAATIESPDGAFACQFPDCPFLTLFELVAIVIPKGAPVPQLIDVVIPGAADRHEPLIVLEVIHAVGCDLPQLLVLEIVGAD